MAISLSGNSNGSGSIHLEGVETLNISSTGVLTAKTPSGDKSLMTTGVSVLPTFGGAAEGRISAATSLTSSYNKINFAVENYDTNNEFESSRFTPTVEGYYFISAVYQMDASAATLAAIFKNGSIWSYGEHPNTAQVSPVRNINSIVYLNGSTDYIEIYGYSSPTSNTNTTNATLSKFQAVFIRHP